LDGFNGVPILPAWKLATIGPGAPFAKHLERRASDGAGADPLCCRERLGACVLDRRRGTRKGDVPLARPGLGGWKAADPD
jgi:hypothetical protein